MLTLELNDSQKIVLFELLHKLETFDIGSAEKKLVEDLLSTLEKLLEEPFSSNYRLIVEAARKAVLNS